MSLGACIEDLKREGALSKDQGDYIASLYDKLRAKQRETFGAFAADAAAGFQTIDALDRGVQLELRQALLDVAAKKSALDEMAHYRSRKGKYDYGSAAEALVVHDDRAHYQNVEYGEMRRRNQAFALMNAVLASHSRNIFGVVRDKAGLRDLLRELRGEKTGNRSAAELAEAVRAAQDLQLAQFNAAGGAIRKLKDRGVGQAYHADKVARAGLDQWKADELAHLDLDRMIDDETGEAFTPEALDQLLDGIYERIRTEGAGEREEGAFGGMKTANRRQERRVLIYKSADDWLAIAEKYGNPNVFDAITGEVHAMARDIAAMERLGPNPAATIRWLKDVIVNRAKKQHGAGSPEANRAQASAAKIDSYWNVLSGASAQGDRNWLSLAGSALRAHQTTSKLGGAAVTALPTDFATQALTRAINGLPVVDMIGQYMKLLSSSGSREQIARLGAISEVSAGSFATQARFFGEELTGEWQARMAEGVMRASGLNFVTDIARKSYFWENLSHITDERGKAWTALDPRFRGMFERYGIDKKGWDELRATPLMEAGGAKWVHPDNMANDRLADRVMEMIYAEQDLAVVTPGVRARAAIAGFGRKGTWQGELARSIFQFKAFPMTILYSHGARMLALEGGFNKAMYAAHFIGVATIAGWVALEAKAMLKGQDPRPINVRTLIASMQQGGGLGIYGDFLFSSQNRAGQGLSSTILGPSASTVDAVSSLLVGTPLLQASGEKVDYDRQLVRLLRSEIPGGSLWYGRLGLDRILLDQWQAAADPNYYRSWKAMERRANDQGTDYWWAPGEMTPGRAPEFSQ